MSKSTLNLGVVVLILFTMTLAGCARYHRLSPAERADRMAERLEEKLDLDQSQRVQLEKIKNEMLAKRAEMKAHRSETFDEIIALLQQDMINKGEIHALIQKHQAHANTLITFFGAKFVEFHAMLTPQQRAQVIPIMEEHQEGKYHRGGKWH